MIAEMVKKIPKHLTQTERSEYLMFVLGYRKQPDKSYISPGGVKIHWRDAMIEVEGVLQSELENLRNTQKTLELKLVSGKK